MQRFLQTLAMYLLCAGLAYSNDLDTLRRIDTYNNINSQEEAFREINNYININSQEQLLYEPLFFQLLITDPPDSGTSGYFVVNIALESLLSGKPIPPNIQRELEAAAADIERRANAKKAKKVE